jgi:hypothetical protein
MITRVIALIIDTIALALCRWVLGLIVGDLSLTGGITRAILYAGVGFLYFGYTWTAWRASPGQRALGLATVNANDGATLTWSQATMRWGFLFGPAILNTIFDTQIGGALGALVGLVVLGYYIYLLYTTAIDPKNQGFHDKQAGSLVTAKAVA